jgi:uncharacterized protein (DUF2147 family)
MTRLFLLLIAASFLINFLQTRSEDAIIGEWYNTEKDGKIEIFKEGDQYHGKLVWLQEPEEDGQPKLDKNNADLSKRDRPLKGLRLLEDFEYRGGTWENGTIYDPKNGKIYSSTIKLKDKDVLEVRGYVGISLIGRTVEWTRAK